MLAFWCQVVGPIIQNGPFIEFSIDEMNYNDARYARDLAQGMPLFVFMIDAGSGTRQCDSSGPELFPQNVRDMRVQTNTMVIAKLDSLKGAVIDGKTEEDVALGHMTPLVQVTEWGIENLTFTRRQAIDEWREHCGWRHRIVDHAKESWLKSMTWIQHQCLNEMQAQILHRSCT